MRTWTGRFLIKDTRRRDGVGTLLDALDLEQQAQVTVRLLDPVLSEDEATVERFHHDLGLLAQLDHPNLPRVIDFGRSDSGQLYVVTERLAGRTLREIMAKEGRVGPVRTLEIIRQSAEALFAAHACGLVHHSLTPERILSTALGRGEEQVLVVDFGVPPAADSVYRSPEAMAGEREDDRSDLWSLGAVAYQLLTGARPKPPGREGEAPASPASTAGTPPGLSTLVMQLLAQAPDNRPVDAGDVLDQVERLVAGSRPGVVAHLEERPSASAVSDMAAETIDLPPPRPAALSPMPPPPEPTPQPVPAAPAAPRPRSRWLYVLAALAGFAFVLGEVYVLRVAEQRVAAPPVVTRPAPPAPGGEAAAAKPPVKPAPAGLPAATAVDAGALVDAGPALRPPPPPPPAAARPTGPEAPLPRRPMPWRRRSRGEMGPVLDLK